MLFHFLTRGSQLTRTTTTKVAHYCHARYGHLAKSGHRVNMKLSQNEKLINGQESLHVRDIRHSNKSRLEGYNSKVHYQFCRSTSSTSDTQQTQPSESFYHRLQEAPSAALYLGFAGLLPFVTPALFCLGSLSYSPLLALIQVTYGSIILSFLGGIHWGYSIDNKASVASWRNLGYSVVPPLIAWMGLLLTPEFGTLTLLAGLAFTWGHDMKIKTTPAWFRALRLCLSVGAIVSLGLMYTLGLLYPPPDTSTTYNWVKLMKIIKIILED